MKISKLKEVLENASEDAEIKIENGEVIITEPQPKDITERIKTFEDAVKWCDENGKKEFVREYYNIYAFCNPTSDLMAYLRLRIITCALNEGWWPKFEMGESRWVVAYDIQYKKFDFYPFSHFTASSNELFYKTKELAKYAAKQFADTYADFFGIKKGGKV